jgi:hypothetical protein
VCGNNPHFLYRVHYIDTGGGVKITAKQHLYAVAQEGSEKAGNNNDGGDGNHNNWETRFSIARDKDLYNIVMQDGDITVETIRNNNDVDSRVHPFAEFLLNYFSMKDDELENLLKKYKVEMESKKRQAIEASMKMEKELADAAKTIPEIIAAKAEKREAIVRRIGRGR